MGSFLWFTVDSKLLEHGLGMIFLGLQIAQSRSYLCTLGPKVASIYIPGAIGFVMVVLLF